VASSVIMARFVTAGAIDPKLCTYVPLGKSNSHTKFRFSLILGLAECDKFTGKWFYKNLEK
jgi:hypothetical protein